MSTETTSATAFVPDAALVGGGPLRHGIDLVHVPRFREVFERHPAFAQRVFTDNERHACERRADPVIHFAARFAAKEAALKSLGLGVGGVGIDRRWQEAEVVRHEGPPHLVLHGSLARAARRAGVVDMAISLSHDGPSAMASVILQTRATDPSPEQTS